LPSNETRPGPDRREMAVASHRERRLMTFSPDQLFDLVADVESYPKFLPWCSDARVISREARGNVVVMLADMTISFKVHKETFRSEVTLDHERHVIGTRYVNGPFKRMVSEWCFEPAGARATNVNFFIDFEFRNRALQMLIGIVFEEATRRIVSAFATRA